MPIVDYEIHIVIRNQGSAMVDQKFIAARVLEPAPGEDLPELKAGANAAKLQALEAAIARLTEEQYRYVESAPAPEGPHVERDT